MLRTILIFGLAAGMVVAVPMNLMMIFGKEGDGSHSLYTGYALMLLAFTFTFLGVKHYRDRTLGGVIRFLPALLVGLGISAVASLIYVFAWEITLHATDFAFIEDYSAAMIEGARAKGASASELAKKAAEMETMKTQYANPLFRLPMTFAEIFPVGLLVSLVSAGLLRNSRFLPMKVTQGL
jgi:hypothetical protein